MHPFSSIIDPTLLPPLSTAGLFHNTFGLRASRPLESKIQANEDHTDRRGAGLRPVKRRHGPYEYVDPPEVYTDWKCDAAFTYLPDRNPVKKHREGYGDNSPSCRAHILNLPREIRWLIYEAYFAHNTQQHTAVPQSNPLITDWQLEDREGLYRRLPPRRRWSTGRFTGRWRVPEGTQRKRNQVPALLQVCRAIRHEAAFIFGRRLSLVVTLDSQVSPNVPASGPNRTYFSDQILRTPPLYARHVTELICSLESCLWADLPLIFESLRIVRAVPDAYLEDAWVSHEEFAWFHRPPLNLPLETLKRSQAIMPFCSECQAAIDEGMIDAAKAGFTVLLHWNLGNDKIIEFDFEEDETPVRVVRNVGGQRQIQDLRKAPRHKYLSKDNDPGVAGVRLLCLYPRY